jgi:hypothetical protein
VAWRKANQDLTLLVPEQGLRIRRGNEDPRRALIMERVQRHQDSMAINRTLGVSSDESTCGIMKTANVESSKFSRALTEPGILT